MRLEMRSIALFAFVCAFPAAAAAESIECRTIPKATDRLACYDRLAPPMAAQKSRPTSIDTSGQQAPATGSQTPLADMLEVENTRLNSKIKSICRGC